MGVFHFISYNRIFTVEVETQGEQAILSLHLTGGKETVCFYFETVVDISLRRAFSGLCEEFGKMKLGEKKMYEVSEKLGLSFKEIGEVYMHLKDVAEVINEVDPKF